MLTYIANLVVQNPTLRWAARTAQERFFYKWSEPNPFKTHRNYHVVSTEPLVIVTPEGVQDLELMSECIKNRRAYFIVAFWWSKETWARAKEIQHCYQKHQARFPAHHITFMCNTPGEYNLLQRLRLPAIYCNQNCLLDETRYRIVEGVPKQYDAVYNGRLEKPKRHYLLTDVPKAALIVAHTPGACEAKRRYRESIRQLLPNAAVLNYPDARLLGDCSEEQFPSIPPEEISPQLCRARVGVILSREEGACYASAEYLLSGLPVVSTRSRGGRDVFFDEEYVEIVPDHPKGIAAGVKRLMERNLSPARIREATLRKMRPHKERFLDMLQAIYDAEKTGFDVRAGWASLYTDKMIRYAGKWPEDFHREVNGPPFPLALPVGDSGMRDSLSSKS